MNAEVMTREERVLDVFEPGVWVRRAAICAEAAMDTATCGFTLKRLVESGVLEFSVVERSQQPRGKQAHIYRLAMRKAQ